ncbi:MAG: hypothetical protein VX763_04160 [Actinomycetota bacterium]|nr:hypothetical protein [Actinomycetota bacterium]
MGEFQDSNIADMRYVFGLPLLVGAITFLPWLVSLPEDPLDSKNLPGLITIFIAPLIVFCLTSMFSKLSTTVSDGKITLVFKYGFPKKEILFSEIKSAELQKVTNWWGSGVKIMRHGSMWRAWGNTAIAIQRHDGKRIVIGSDNPDELLQAIRSGLGN